MMFIEQDEHIIIMEDFYNPFNRDDLSMLEDTGIKTIYMTSPICWNRIYKRDSSEKEWSELDRKLDVLLQSNFKLLMPFYHTMPDWFPNSWYLMKHELETHIIPNYGNKEFQQAVDTFAYEVLDHFSDITNRMQLTYSIPAGGEFLWESTFSVRQFPATVDDVKDFVIGRQRLLSKQYGEMWLLFHNFLGTLDNWNNQYLPDLYQALIDEFPDVPLYSIQGAHFACGNSPTYEGGQDKVRTYNERYGVKFFVGSEYCEGLVTNFDAAVRQNVYGFLTSPLHHQNPNKPVHMEGWMVENLKEADRKLKEIWNENSY